MSKLNIESRVYRLTGLTPILGGLPASKEIRSIYINSRAQTEADRQEEEGLPIDYTEMGMTVFSRDRLNQLCIMGYQVKGFFKSALNALRGQYRIYAYKSKIDLMLFVEPRFIPLLRDGRPIQQEDDMLERPIRLSGKGGEFTGLKSSEMVKDPWSVEVEISLIPPEKKEAAKGDHLNWDVVEAALDYGAYHGMGQWRNADYGRFLWERIED